MFIINDFNNLEPLNIYIANPIGELLYPINEYVEDESANLKINLNHQNELSITVKYPAEKVLGEYLQEGMYLFVEKVGLFKMKQPQSENDGVTETKTITAYSCDAELEDKTCKLSINMGVETSQEYLVNYEENEQELLVNPYTNIPYDWIVLHNTFPEQLEKFKEVFINEHTDYANEDGVTINIGDADYEKISNLLELIPRLKHRFIANEEGVYEPTEYVSNNYNQTTNELESVTLSKDFISRVDELITFYNKYKEQLSLISILLEKTDGNWTVGDIYGISDDDYTLANTKCQFDIDENIYSFFTQTLAKNIECVVNFDILNRRVNVTPVDKIGNDTGIVFSYDNLMNTLGISVDEENLCTRLHITGANDLGIEQVNFGRGYVDNLNYKIDAKDSNGNRIYISDDLAEKYHKYEEFVELKRADYISLSKEYNNYSEQIDEIKYRVPNDDLKTDWGTFTKEELNAALTSYKNLLVTLITLYKEDYGEAGINEDDSVNEDFIKDTEYWYDYEAYKGIIAEIECAISVHPYYSQEDKWTQTQLDTHKDKISEWETEWSLYGSIELQAKIDSYTQNMNLLAESSVLRKDSSDDIYKWDELTNAQKAEYNAQAINYQYDTYINLYELRESAKKYLNTLLEEINNLEQLRETTQQTRVDIVNSISLTENFIKDDIKALNLLIKESDYTNENILTTSIDTYDDKIDRMYELLEDGKEKVSIFSRPQLTFNINSDNLFGSTEFQAFWNDFKCGNYIAVQYRDDTYVKLRLIGYEFNPCLPSSEDFKLIFSNYVRSRSKVSDVASILELSSSTSSSGSSSAGGSSGEYGKSDDIDVTISDTMLAKLLNSEMFGSRVRNVILDTIDVNALTAKTTKTGVILSSNYNSDHNSENHKLANTEGSIIDLRDGTFNFGGGSLHWNGEKLNVKGDVIVEEKDSEGNSVILGLTEVIQYDSVEGKYLEEYTKSILINSDSYSKNSTNYTEPYNLDDFSSDNANDNQLGTLFNPASTLKDRKITFFKSGICEIPNNISVSARTYFEIKINDKQYNTYLANGAYFDITDKIKEHISYEIRNDDSYCFDGKNGLYISIKESLRDSLIEYAKEQQFASYSDTITYSYAELMEMFDVSDTDIQISLTYIDFIIPAETATKYTYNSDLDGYDDFGIDFIYKVYMQLYNTETPVYIDTNGDVNLSYVTKISLGKLPIWKQMRNCYTNLLADSILTVYQNGDITFSINKNGVYTDKIAHKEKIILSAPEINLIGSLTPQIIPSGANFNDYTEFNSYVGYAALGDGTTANYENSPSSVNAAFKLEVSPTGGGDQLMQKITLCSKGYGRKWERHYHSGSWGAWYCTYSDRNNVLWSGAHFMNEGQTIELNEPISKQPSGIVLRWSYYTDATVGDNDDGINNPTAQNYNFIYKFIPKNHVLAHPGGGVLIDDAYAGLHKYVYVYDDHITGNVLNDDTGALNNIAYNNAKYVLRAVIGV